MEEKQVTVKGGRKRKNLVKFYLNDEEYQKLCENAATFGLLLLYFLHYVGI